MTDTRLSDKKKTALFNGEHYSFAGERLEWRPVLNYIDMPTDILSIEKITEGDVDCLEIICGDGTYFLKGNSPENFYIQKAVVLRRREPVVG